MVPNNERLIAIEPHRERVRKSQDSSMLSIGAIIKEMVPHQIPRRQMVLGQRALDILPRSTLLVSIVARNVRERGDAEAELKVMVARVDKRRSMKELTIPEKNPNPRLCCQILQFFSVQSNFRV